MNKLELLKITSENGVIGRKEENRKKIIRLLSRTEDSLSIPKIAESIDVSIPICTTLIKEFVDGGLIIREGKKVSENGRRPYTFSINKNRFFVIGVEILSKFIHLSIVTTDLKTKHTLVDRNFQLNYDEKSLEYILSFIKKAIKEAGVEKENIIGLGVGIPDVVKDKNGALTTYFSDKKTSLKYYLESHLDISVLVENDARTISVAEQTLGIAKGIDNVLVIKVSRTLGLSIISDKHIIKGSFGLAGNFNHTQFDKGSRLCNCGKTGCIGTQIGGNALLNDLKEALLDNETSIYFNTKEIDSYKYHDVLDTVLKGDELSIKLIQKQGHLLGKALGNIINLFDPELVLIGGEYVMVKDFFIDAVKMGAKKTTLINSINHCKIEVSTLGRYLGSKAGAAMILKASGMIDF
ncbi:MAG: ROK family protein [Polaribacter sp.]